MRAAKCTTGHEGVQVHAGGQITAHTGSDSWGAVDVG